MPTDGKLKFSFDIKPNDKTTKVNIMTDAGNIHTLFFNEGRLYRGWNNDLIDSIGTYTVNQWQHYDVTIDFAGGSMSYTLPKFPYIYTRSSPMEKEVIKAATRIKYICLSATGSATTDASFDNIQISCVSSNPSVGSIEFYTGDVKENDLSALNPSTDRIKLDFGTAMKRASLAENISVEKTSTGTKIPFGNIFDGTMYTLKLAEPLEENTEYKLIASKNVENTSGTKIGSDYSKVFKTAGGKFLARIDGIYQNGLRATKFDDLSAGDAYVKIAYENTTATDKNAKLICAYYNGKQLKGVTMRDVTLYSGKSECRAMVDIEQPTGAETVRLMLWEDAVRLTPICASVELK